MKKVNIKYISSDECIGIQLNGLAHCSSINCKWQGISACEGQNFIKTKQNRKGVTIGKDGIELDSTNNKINKF